jgi:hypothetical protein
MTTARRTVRPPARRRAPARPAWWIPVLAAAATGLIGLAFVPDPVPAPLAQDAAAIAAVDMAGVDPGAAPALPPAAAAAAANVPGAIVVPVPGGVAAPTFVVPRPVVVPGAVVPPYVPVGKAARTSPPRARCGGYTTPRQVTPAVTPGRGRATVTFPADGSAPVRSYRVQAISQRLVAGRQLPPVVAAAAQKRACGQVTVTLRGLRSGTAYVFLLEEQTPDPHYPVTRFVQVGRSDAVVIG